ncbi:DUF1499 domain-containing protein [Erythrobacter arachoides]|uniref:DUF1499 domain-containing protein n=1 Tax=Aurantiacibacter arachoides TaxID=1850444 RepID=A0A845A3Q3_9SPHN|nr:DUF1499 domain-containing protein [Aurantiacibacter arachoides]MXO93756.1 DUF1499 domain-containing protein [Aurantiacibacter arachoides]GGD46889.1 hypothetical protein GCM10011411_03260 [Aurantiacibacter arachoides]
MTDNTFALPAAAIPSRRQPAWSWRIGVFALGGAVLAVLIAGLMLTLARFDVIDKLTGFGWYVKSNYIGLASALVGLIAVVWASARKTPGRLAGAVALVIGLGMAGVFYAMVMAPAQAAPFMHDVTTDVADPPQFTALPLREDNLDQYDGDIEAWRAMHREGYPDIQPIIVNLPPAEVLARARAMAEDRGWDVAAYDSASGHMEATANAGYLRFRDDVIVEATPIADGSTRVDMRSVSRVGGSDLGYNAARIREFLIDLSRAG